MLLDENYVEKFSEKLCQSHKKECFFWRKHISEASNLFKITREFLYLEWEKFYLDNFNSYQGQNEEIIEIPLINQSFIKKIVKIY